MVSIPKVFPLPTAGCRQPFVSSDLWFLFQSSRIRRRGRFSRVAPYHHIHFSQRASHRGDCLYLTTDHGELCMGIPLFTVGYFLLR